MPKDKRIDSYIERSAEFARPILTHFRELVHEVCPDVTETMKWSFPHFDHKGEMMCSMASFKKHCAVGFWKAALMSSGKVLVEKAKTEEAMGHLGKISSLKDLPSDRVLKKYIKEAVKLNEDGVKMLAKKNSASKKEIIIHPELKKALAKNKKAKNTFDGFSPSCKWEYTDWINEAKRNETRTKRISQAIEMMSEGKDRNWKYK